MGETQFPNIGDFFDDSIENYVMGVEWKRFVHVKKDIQSQS